MSTSHRPCRWLLLVLLGLAGNLALAADDFEQARHQMIDLIEGDVGR